MATLTDTLELLAPLAVASLLRILQVLVEQRVRGQREGGRNPINLKDAADQRQMQKNISPGLPLLLSLWPCCAVFRVDHGRPVLVCFPNSNLFEQVGNAD